jgi:hypothetical protein
MSNKKVTTSKKILLASYFCSICLTLLVVAGTFAGYEMTNLTQIASLAWGEVAVSNAFYYRKAQKENQIKIAIGLSQKLKQEVDINNLINN